ncbi:hypothetical protein [Nocardioides sambongensis]|uniref:hypothetical protein n=1 Tax=Nocardioides sambongensis TaxID=2589074 RepID=UPI001127FA09|nr:hypothetical protein [Nocardioides sambongensis]
MELAVADGEHFVEHVLDGLVAAVQVEAAVAIRVLDQRHEFLLSGHRGGIDGLAGAADAHLRAVRGVPPSGSAPSSGTSVADSVDDDVVGELEVAVAEESSSAAAVQAAATGMMMSMLAAASFLRDFTWCLVSSGGSTPPTITISAVRSLIRVCAVPMDFDSGLGSALGGTGGFP